jgi:putative Mg2+ transporter-C (MgtC) family protein
MIATLSQSSLVIPLIVSAALGALVGLERSIAGKHAGMRTYALVSLGSCLFTLIGVVAAYTFSVFPGINPLSLASSVVVGIGFIGAGLAAFKGSDHAELTTASGVWVVSAVGVACGLGLYGAAIATAILAVLVFSVFLRMENFIRRRFGSTD